jgi:hypothetical protein
MRKSIQLGLILMAMAAPLPAMAQATAPVEATQVQTPASVLATLLSKEERQFGQLVPMVDSFFTQLKLSTPEVADLSAEYPGLEAVWKKAMMPILIDEVRASLPEYRRELAALFTEKFTPGELAQLNRFWGSPVGQHLLEKASSSIRFNQISKELASEIEDENLDVSKSAYEKDKQAAVARTVRSLTPEQLAELARFEQSPVGQKFVRLRDQKQQIDLRYFNKEPSDATNAKIEKEVTEAIDRHIADTDRKRASDAKQAKPAKK